MHTHQEHEPEKVLSITSISPWEDGATECASPGSPSTKQVS